MLTRLQQHLVHFECRVLRSFVLHCMWQVYPLCGVPRLQSCCDPQHRSSAPISASHIRANADKSPPIARSRAVTASSWLHTCHHGEYAAAHVAGHVEGVAAARWRGGAGGRRSAVGAVTAALLASPAAGQWSVVSDPSRSTVHGLTSAPKTTACCCSCCSCRKAVAAASRAGHSSCAAEIVVSADGGGAATIGSWLPQQAHSCGAIGALGLEQSLLARPEPT